MQTLAGDSSGRTLQGSDCRDGTKRFHAIIASSRSKGIRLNDRYRRCARTAVLGLALLGAVGSAQAQFGASGTSDLPLHWVFGPWIVLVGALSAAWWLRPSWRPRLCKAMRRGVLAYLFVEFVPVLVCMFAAGLFDVWKTAAMMFWALSFLGVIFSGLVLLVLVSLALALDWVFSCRRVAQQP